MQPEGVSVHDLGRAIDAGDTVYVLRGAYTDTEMAELRQMVRDWAHATEAWPQGVSASKEAINFHRVDDGSIKGRMAHIFHQFGFGQPADLPEPLRGALGTIAGELYDLQNRLAGTDFAAGDPSFRSKVIRHPRGGGYLVPHVHPYLPQKVSLFLNLSKPGRDYQSGSVRFKPAGGDWIDTHEDFQSGDLLAWRYDMLHETTAVDPEAEIDWAGDDGLWIFATEWVEAHLNSNASY